MIQFVQCGFLFCGILTCSDVLIVIGCRVLCIYYTPIYWFIYHSCSLTHKSCDVLSKLSFGVFLAMKSSMHMYFVGPILYLLLILCISRSLHPGNSIWWDFFMVRSGQNDLVVCPILGIFVITVTEYDTFLAIIFIWYICYICGDLFWHWVHC